MREPLDLTPEKALIFRVTHRNNVPWILSNGQWSRNSGRVDPEFVTIGNTELIEGRVDKPVPIPPGGVLSDYVSFYFTPCSPMLLNIVTGVNVQRRDKDEIVVLVSSLHKVIENDRPFVFTERHAYLRYLSTRNYSNNLDDLSRMIPWELLQQRDFSRDPEDPEKSERYQAKALVYEHLPAGALLGIVTYNEEEAEKVRACVSPTFSTGGVNGLESLINRCSGLKGLHYRKVGWGIRRAGRWRRSWGVVAVAG